MNFLFISPCKSNHVYVIIMLFNIMDNVISNFDVFAMDIFPRAGLCGNTYIHRASCSDNP